jgi:hypothetical protein
MVRKGYIERLIEDMGITIARILGFRQQRDFKGAILALQDAAEGLTGMKMETLLKLDVETLLTIFRTSEVLDSGRCLMAGLIFRELAQIAEAQGSTPLVIPAYTKAAVLLGESLYADPTLRVEPYVMQWHECLAHAPTTSLLAHEKAARLQTELDSTAKDT